MYWCKQRAYLLFSFTIAISLLSGLSSCRPDSKEVSGKLTYFDLKGFIKTDSSKLSRLHPKVTKTVQHNDKAETKEVTINNWGEELALFTQSDINKPAWRQSYKVESSPKFIIYNALDEHLTTRKIIINRDSSTQKIKWILINNRTKNLLYTSVEKLTYYPDSLYLIQKRQVIRFIGTNTYSIKGVIH